MKKIIIASAVSALFLAPVMAFAQAADAPKSPAYVHRQCLPGQPIHIPRPCPDQR